MSYDKVGIGNWDWKKRTTSIFYLDVLFNWNKLNTMFLTSQEWVFWRSSHIQCHCINIDWFFWWLQWLLQCMNPKSKTQDWEGPDSIATMTQNGNEMNGALHHGSACQTTLDLGQPGLMRWIVVWIVPQVQDQSVHLLTCSTACKQYVVIPTPHHHQ